MNRIKLSDVLRSRRTKRSGRAFSKNAVRNPFDDDKGMDDFVRDRGARQGLDRVSRAHTGPESGVNASSYDDMVRDFDDLDYEQRNPRIRRSAADYVPDEYEDEDDLYLSGKDRSYKRNEFNQDSDANDFDAEAGWAFMKNLASQYDDEMMHEDDEEIEDEESYNDEAGKYDGVVRSVKGAYLVSKDQQPDDTYTEVWIYNVGDKFEDEANIRKSILAATDIDPTKNFSEDGSQEASFQTIGNVQFLTLSGLPD